MPEEEKRDNRPTHELKLLDTDSGDTSVVGVAWAKENGTISVKLNPGVVLSYDNLKGKFLTLFKTRTKEEWDAYHAEKRRKQEAEKDGKPDYQGVKTWKEQHPEYIRKTHWRFATSKQCPSIKLGNPDFADDIASVTCGKCKNAIAKRQSPATT
jgi:hypothetical protein